MMNLLSGDGDCILDVVEITSWTTCIALLVDMVSLKCYLIFNISYDYDWRSLPAALYKIRKIHVSCFYFLRKIN